MFLLVFLVLSRAVFTHNRTLDVRQGRISKALELHYDYNLKGVMGLWDDKIRLLNFALRSSHVSMFLYGI